MILPAGHLEAGQYRVQLTYLRENRAADPGSQVLREAGPGTPEVVTLDIPGRRIKFKGTLTRASSIVDDCSLPLHLRNKRHVGIKEH
jgi:hypothetical protein